MAQASTPSPTRADSPKLPVMWAAGLVFAALLLVAGARISGVSPVQDVGAADVVQSRLLRFAGDAKGVAVVDATSGQLITHTSAEGFIPGVLRGLNRMRQTEQADIAQAYRLERLSNGQLLLIDTASGISLDLAAYGHDNAALMATFLSSTGGN